MLKRTKASSRFSVNRELGAQELVCGLGAAITTLDRGPVTRSGVAELNYSTL